MRCSKPYISSIPNKIVITKEGFNCLNDIPFDTVENESNELLIGPNHANINMYIEIRSKTNNDLVSLQESCTRFYFLRL